MRRFVLLLLCAAGLACPVRASAQPAAPIELQWDALENCPSADSVLSRVRKIAGATRPTPNVLRAAATITQPKEGLFRLRLEIEYGKLAAVRNIEGKSCKDLAGATAVALALLLSSEEPLSESDLAGTSSTTSGTAAGEEGKNQPAPPSESSQAKPNSAEVDTPPVATAVDAGSSRRWRLLLAAPVGALGFGPMKETSKGLGVAAGLSYDRWRFFAEGTRWGSQRETLSHLGEDYAAELKRFTLGARACRSVFGSRFELESCALITVHHLAVLGSGPNLTSGGETATWGAVGIGARARLLIAPWFGLVVGVDGEIEFARPEVSLSLPMVGLTGAPIEAIPVERLAPVAATITVGSQWIF